MMYRWTEPWFNNGFLSVKTKSFLSNHKSIKVPKSVAENSGPWNIQRLFPRVKPQINELTDTRE